MGDELVLRGLATAHLLQVSGTIAIDARVGGHGDPTQVSRSGTASATFPLHLPAGPSRAQMCPSSSLRAGLTNSPLVPRRPTADRPTTDKIGAVVPSNRASTYLDPPSGTPCPRKQIGRAHV